MHEDFVDTASWNYTFDLTTFFNSFFTESIRTVVGIIGVGRKGDHQ